MTRVSVPMIKVCTVSRMMRELQCQLTSGVLTQVAPNPPPTNAVHAANTKNPVTIPMYENINLHIKTC